MNSLEELNNAGAELITFTDNREPGPVFDRPVGVDIDTILTYSFSFTLDPYVDLVEIIRPSDADLKFILDFSDIAGATASWSTIPAGVIVYNVGQVYTITGIDTLAKWNAMKNPTINIPNTFSGSFFYTIKFTWLNIIGNLQQVSWQVGRFIPTAECNAISTISCSPNYIRGGTYELLSTFLLTSVPIETLGAQFFVNANPVKTVRPGSTISSDASISTTANNFTYDNNIQINNFELSTNKNLNDYQIGNCLDLKNNYAIVGLKSNTYSGHVIRLNDGTILDSLPRQSLAVETKDIKLSPNETYIGVLEAGPLYATLINRFYLYKQVGSTGTYTLFGSIILPDSTLSASNSGSIRGFVLTEDYIVFNWTAQNLSTNDTVSNVYVYKINNATNTIDNLYNYENLASSVNATASAIAIDSTNNYLFIYKFVAGGIGHSYDVYDITTQNNLLKTIDLQTNIVPRNKSVVANNGLLYTPGEIWNSVTNTQITSNFPQNNEDYLSISDLFYAYSKDLYRKTNYSLYGTINQPNAVLNNSNQQIIISADYAVKGYTKNFFTNSITSVNQGSPDTLTFELDEGFNIILNTRITFHGTNVTNLGLIEGATYFIKTNEGSNNYSISNNYNGTALSLNTTDVSGITYRIQTGTAYIGYQT